MAASTFATHFGRESNNPTSSIINININTHNNNNNNNNSTQPRSPHRRILSRGSQSPSPSPSSSRNSSISLHNIFHSHTFNSRPTTPASSSPTSPITNPALNPISTSKQPESDEECWERMLDLQMEYHCYKSARLEAAVEARRSGCSMEEIRRPSRLCLDLLDEELTAKLESEQRIEI